MITFSAKIRECAFQKVILDNMNFQENYLDALHYQLMIERGDEPIKFLPFFMMVQAHFDHEFFQSVTGGNMDADL